MSQQSKTDKDIASKANPISYYHPGVNPIKMQLLTKYINYGSILDVGCGNGLYTFNLQNICSNILQIDLVDRRNEQARELPFKSINAEYLSSIEGTFDNIIAFDIIEHLNDDSKYLKSAYNLLNQGGKLFVSVPNEDNSILEKLDLAHIHFTDKTHCREYSAKSLKSKIEESGFAVIEIVPHVNKSILSFPKILEKNTLLSRIIAKLISYQIRILEKLGIFENKVVADWFLVAIK